MAGEIKYCWKCGEILDGNEYCENCGNSLSVQFERAMLPCSICKHFIVEERHYSLECFECSRYYSDKFEERKDAMNKLND